MGCNRVVVLDNGSLLVSGVLSLLREHPAIECVTVRENGDDPSGEIRLMAPDVVVLAAMGAADDVPVTIARLLRACPQTRVVVLALDRSRIEVYRSHRLEHVSVADFLATVAGH